MYEPQSIRSDDGSGVDNHLPLEEQVAALQQSLEQAKQKSRQNLDELRRAQAELVNYRRRTDDERIEFTKHANSRLIAKFLPVMEEMDLAINNAEKNGAAGPWLDGVKLIQRKLMNLLESEGVSKIDAVGALFDPLQHEALGTEETTRLDPGYVTEVVRPGYRMHDRVIQAAQVIVAKRPQNAN